MERRIVAENKLTTVFVVRIDSTIDCSTDTDIKVFSTYEKANDHLMELDDKFVYEEENFFSVYQEGSWSEDHYEIEIDEMEVH